MTSHSCRCRFGLALLAICLASHCLTVQSRAETPAAGDVGDKVSPDGTTRTVAVSTARPDRSTQASIPVGMSTALSGPAASLGQNVRAGVMAAFAEANQQGGIGGRPLRLVALDDGYEPARTAPNMRQLIEQDKVVAIIGNVGTPTAIAAIPIANATRTVLFGAYTGAGVLRKRPPDRYVINYRASYAEETAAMVDALIEQAGLRPEQIAFFTQRDGYGDAGFVGGIEALRKHGLADESLVAHGRYERNTTAVERALAEILLHPLPPKAVIMVGAYRPCAQFIRLARSARLDVYFLNVSFVGAIPLAKELGTRGDGVIITQVVPHPLSPVPFAQAHQSALTAHQPNKRPTFGSFEGYTAARILLRALRKVDGPITREAVVDGLESLGTFQLGTGQPLHLSPDEHQASHVVWPTAIRNGEVVAIEWEQLRKDP